MTERIYDTFAPIESVELTTILDLMQIHPGDTLCDVGCGDGRVLRAAAERGAFVTGIEYDPTLCATSETMLRDTGLAGTIICADFYTTNFAGYDIIFTNLSEDVCRALWDQLVTAKTQGARIFMYMGVRGYRRCHTSAPCLYDDPPSNTTVHTFDSTIAPWFMEFPQYGGPAVPNTSFTHVVLAL